MRTRVWAFTLCLLVAVAPAAALACHCTRGDCGGMREAAELLKAPQCHPLSATSGNKPSSAKDCCGKCQIERAELSSQKFIKDTVVRAAPASLLFGRKDVFQTSSAIPVKRDAFRDGRIDFFTGYVLNATFAFRGPPQG